MSKYFNNRLFQILKWQISLPLHILQFVKSLTFYTPEAWKRHPFRAEPPRIANSRENRPGYKQVRKSLVSRAGVRPTRGSHIALAFLLYCYTDFIAKLAYTLSKLRLKLVFSVGLQKANLRTNLTELFMAWLR